MNRSFLCLQFILALAFAVTIPIQAQDLIWKEFCSQFSKMPNRQVVFDRLEELIESDSISLREKLFAYTLKASVLGHSGDLKQAQSLVDEAYKLPEAEKDVLAFRRLLHADSIIAASKFENQRSIQLATKCIEYCNRIDANDPFLASPLVERGIAYQQENRFTDAIKDYQRALEVCNKHNLDYRTLQVRTNLGSVFNELKAFDEAQKQYDIGLEDARRLNQPVQEVLLLVNLGNNAIDSDRSDQAEKYYLEALEIKNSSSIVPPNGNLFIGLGDLATSRHEHEKAKQNYQIALREFRSMQDKTGINLAESRLARESVSIERAQKSPPQEIENAIDRQIAKIEKSVEAARERGEQTALLHLLEQLGDLYEEKGDFEQAFLTLREAEENKRKERREISRLSVSTINEREHAIERLNRSNRMLWMCLIAIGIGSGLLLLVWYGKRIIGQRLLAANAFARDQQQKNSILQFQLAETEKAAVLSTMSSGVLHDFNNYLAAIASCSEVGLMVDANRKDEFLAAALKSCMSASNLSQQLFEFAGQGRPNPVSSCDVIKIVRDNRVAWENLCHESIQLGVSLPSDNAVFVPLSSMQLERIIINLLKNSSESLGPNSGQIQLKVSLIRNAEVIPDQQLGQEFVNLEICDNGPGMDEQVLRSSVDPYFSTKGIGRGLGLATVKGIVERNGGSIRIDSMTGVGATVALALPRLSQDENSRIMEIRERGKTEKQDLIPPELSVVLVEDDQTVLKGLCVYLETQGVTPVAFEEAGEALEYLSSPDRHVDVVITDFALANSINGSEIAEAAKSHFPECRVLLMSGFAEDEIFQNSIFDGFLSKPFSLREFHQAIALLPTCSNVNPSETNA